MEPLLEAEKRVVEKFGTIQKLFELVLDLEH
jgi:hypothetical protein